MDAESERDVYTEFMLNILQRGVQTRAPDESIIQAAQRAYRNIPLPDQAEWPLFFTVFAVLLDPECQFGIPLCPQPYLTVACPALGSVEPPAQRRGWTEEKN